LATWFKESKSHLYSIWPRGQLPQEAVDTFSLRAWDMHKEDAARFFPTQVDEGLEEGEQREEN